MTMRPIHFALLAATALTSLSAMPAWAAADEDDTIIVTGTRAKDRTITDSPVPVDVLTADALTQSGTTGELAQAIQNLTPSFNFPRQSNSGAGDAVRAAQLRGMSPDQTLVLVNGKRYHTTSSPNLDTKIGRGTTPVDFNTLPINAVSRIEVLRDAAGAQYGSDAIAGVVNVGLDRSDSGASFGATYGLNVTNPGVLDDNITDGQTMLLDAKFGFKVGEDGFLSVGGDYLYQQGTNRAGRDQGGQFLTNGSYSDPRNDRFFGQRLFKVGDPQVDGGHLWYNTEFAVGDLRAYSFGIGHLRQATGANFFRWPVIVDGQGNNYVSPVQPGGLDGFRPESRIKNGDVSLTAGLKGEAGAWRLDGSATYGVNAITQRLRNSVNYSLGAASPTSFLMARSRFDQVTLNFDAAREFELGFASPLTFATGVEFRHERWRSSPGELASYQVGPLADPAGLGLAPGAQAGPGLTPEDARTLKRQVYALYAEASAEVVDTLFVDVAGRLEYYSDAGAALAGKAAARWEFTPGMALRGSVSNSFRAPALAQQGVSSTSLNFGAGGTLRRVATLPVDSTPARSLGALPLDPERSFNLSAGITASPMRGLRLSVDVFRTLVNNRITLSERFDLGGVSPAQRTALGLGSYDAINFFTNAVDLKTQGVEAVIAYSTEALGGNLNVNAGYSYFENSIR
ncbi:TonB-dependent receptor domain-containing protein, partial [Sandarakinorhabdus sp.]|uniref:TonB-dependent receptor plug domain-containing protein n=1 Tax=Sandarakinorhabdus sp. TaxID=1916663 RepID=UPI00286D70B2